ncbi:MAG: hypothetical protein L0229_04130 [Blastocatellia bacterium]|nr:hypothetical protein [Blastocatellia bacterium]
MTSEEMERAIEFLLNSQAQLTGDIQGLKESVQGLTNVQKQTSEDVSALASAVGELTGVVVNLADIVAGIENRMDRFEAQAEEDRREMRQAIVRLEEQAKTTREEMRDSFDKLILGNEVTRDLTKQVASLEVQTSKRVTGLEGRMTDLESKLP